MPRLLAFWQRHTVPMPPPTPDFELQNPLILLAHFSALFASLTIQSNAARHFIFIPLIIYTAYVLFTQPISNDRVAAYSAASVWATYLGILEKLLFSVPEDTFFRPSLEKRGDPAHYGLLKKLQWAGSLFVSQRGTGWNFQVRNVPKMGTRFESRAKFLRAEVVRMVVVYIVMDLAHTYAMQQPHHEYVSLAHRDVWHRVWDALAYGAQGWGTIQMSYRVASVLAVATGLSSPQDWPPLFGSLFDAYTVGRFWGKVWHQMIRRAVATYSSFLLRTLGIQHRSRAWYILTVYISFFLSALFHALATLPPGKLSGQRVGWGVFAFHFSQAVGITIESIVIEAYRRVFGELRGWCKLVGYVWVLAWIVVTVVWEMDDFIRAGLFETDPVPWSVIRTGMAWWGDR